jgi:transcriptional antiterminator Rof (Rho-off)
MLFFISPFEMLRCSQYANPYATCCVHLDVEIEEKDKQDWLGEAAETDRRWQAAGFYSSEATTQGTQLVVPFEFFNMCSESLFCIIVEDRLLDHGYINNRSRVQL